MDYQEVRTFLLFLAYPSFLFPLPILSNLFVSPVVLYPSPSTRWIISNSSMRNLPLDKADPRTNIPLSSKLMEECWSYLTLTATSTGTTIVGLKFGGGDSGEEEGICLGADTRATGGPIVADKNCEKVSPWSFFYHPSSTFQIINRSNQGMETSGE